MRYIFENYAFDTDRRELHHGADVVAVTPQVFDLLDYLIRNRERVVSKDDLISAIWNGRSVSDAAVTTRLNAVRSAIGDSGEEQRLIKTLPRKGFRFVGPVREAQGAAGVVGDDSPMEPPKPALPLPDKPSVAVLPFTNLSSDPEQEYFADGMVEEIITALSRNKQLFVIARNSSFTFKGRAVDVKRVGRELGVRYLLEGSVRKAGDRVRITGQLVDAETGNHIWADRYDSTLEDIFDLQDRVTSSVIGAIAPQLERAEIARSQRKPTDSLQAYDYYLRALASNYCFTREANAEALRLCQIANQLDPDFALAYELGARMLGQKKGFGWREDTVAEIREARRLAKRALELDRTDATVLAGAGHALCFVVREVEEGADLLSRAISLDPNLAFARLWSGWAQVYLGDGDAAMEQFHVALRLSPLDPRIFLSQTGLAYAHFLAGRYEDASSWAKTAIRQQSNYLVPHRILMASLAMAGRVDEAREVCAGALQIDPFQRISKIKNKKFIDPFRIAGMPE